MNLFGNLVAEYLKLRISKIRHYLEHPMEVQLSLLAGLLDDARDTEIGRTYGFEDIADYAAFRERVPVVTYEGFFPYIQRVINGEQQVIWPSEIKWFAKSSGTTSDKSKFIPVSKEALDTCHFRGPRDLMCMYAHNNPGTQVFSGKSLIMGGSQKVHETNEHMRYGDVSAVMMKNQPLLASVLRTPNLEIALMEDWEAKIERMAEETIPQNITNLGGVPTWTLVLIKRILEITGKDNLLSVWPNLEVYMHGGVSFQPYEATFRELIRSDDFNYYQTYNASEGFFAYQFENGARDMVLALNNGIFFEFIPQGHYNDPDPPTVLLDEVEIGRHYALVITTNAGLWRYKVGDTVQFTARDPFRIKVSGRTKHFINAFGEEVIIDNAEHAMTTACARSGAHVREYTVAPVYFAGEEKARHQWLIEFEIRPPSCDDFMRELDTALQSVNSDYEAKRKGDMALTLPQLTVAREGLFHDWLKSKGKLGGQHKVPRLSNDRTYMDELLKMNVSTA